jgi:hypothetical protein
MESASEKLSGDVYKDAKFRKLRNLNIAMGFLHLVQGALMLVLANEATLPIQTNFVAFNPDTGQLFTVTDTIIDLKLGPFVAMFLFVSMIAHFSVSSPWGYGWYVRNLKQGINKARWYEYAVSSSIMVVVIAMLCGIYELGSLMVIFALNATMNLFGLMMELHNQTTKKTNWTSFIYGCFAGLIVWVVLGIYFFGAVGLAGGDFPLFVIFIFVSLAVFFNIFAVNMVLQYRAKGRWKDYLFGEKVYIILSLTAKSALAWQVFAGTLQGPVSGA